MQCASQGFALHVNTDRWVESLDGLRCAGRAGTRACSLQQWSGWTTCIAWLKKSRPQQSRVVKYALVSWSCLLFLFRGAVAAEVGLLFCHYIDES